MGGCPVSFDGLVEESVGAPGHVEGIENDFLHDIWEGFVEEDFKD